MINLMSEKSSQSAYRVIGDGEVYPVLVSPRPNRENHIVVAYSNLSTKAYLTSEFPPEIAQFFE